MMLWLIYNKFQVKVKAHMNLPNEDVVRFYKIWLALLRYTNAQRNICPGLHHKPQDEPIPSEDAMKIREVLWKDTSARDEFISKTPSQLPTEDLAIVNSWQHRIAGDFYIFRYLKKYTIFLQDNNPPRAYGVLGLVTPLEELFGPYLPIMVNTVLIPYKDNLIYDGLFSYYNITFGGGIRRRLNETYRDIQEREGIITSLIPKKQQGLQNIDEIESRNKKMLKLFLQDLYASGLSEKKVEEHISNIEGFANSYLMLQKPASLLVEIGSNDVKGYLTSENLDAKKRKAIVTSLKRFTRFLYQSGRMHSDTAFAIQELLKSYL